MASSSRALSFAKGRLSTNSLNASLLLFSRAARAPSWVSLREPMMLERVLLSKKPSISLIAAALFPLAMAVSSSLRPVVALPVAVISPARSAAMVLPLATALSIMACRTEEGRNCFMAFSRFSNFAVLAVLSPSSALISALGSSFVRSMLLRALIIVFTSQSFKSWPTKSALAASAAFSSSANLLVDRALIIVLKAALPFLLSVPSSSISLSQDIKLRTPLSASAFLLRAPSRSSTALTLPLAKRSLMMLTTLAQLQSPMLNFARISFSTSGWQALIATTISLDVEESKVNSLENRASSALLASVVSTLSRDLTAVRNFDSRD